jgi:hypothetical protein
VRFVKDAVFLSSLLFVESNDRSSKRVDVVRERGSGSSSSSRDPEKIAVK